MKISELTKKISRKEGKRKPTLIGNIREIVGIMSDLCYSNSEVVELLIKNGKRRSKRKPPVTPSFLKGFK